MAVMPWRASFLGHDLNVFMAFLKPGASKIRRRFHFQRFASAFAFWRFEIENTGAVLVISDPLNEPETAIGAVHVSPYLVAFPRLHMDS